MIRVCLLLIAGGYIAQHSRVPIGSDVCTLLLVASIAMLTCRLTRIPGWAALGFSLFVLAGQAIVGDRLEPRFAGDSLLTQVRIVSFPKTMGAAVVMLVEPVDDLRLPPRSRISWYEPKQQPAIGDVWELELRLKRPRGYSNPGGFDFEAWMFRQKIHATGYVVDGKRNRLLRTGTEGPIDRLRGRFVARADRAAALPETAAVLAAIGVGARHRISRAQWDMYAISGTSHLMAISGLHIGLAASVAFFIASALLGVSRTKGNSYVRALLVGVLVAAAYATVSGLGVPARRALLMLLVFACAVARRRHIDGIATVAVAATSIYILDPVAIMAPGFNLSFAAVLLLLWLAKRRETLAETPGLARKTLNLLRRLFGMQVFLLFGLMPLTICFFQRIAFLATPVNLLAVPLFSAVTVPFTLAGLALGDGYGRLGHHALQIAGKSIDVFLTLIEYVVRLPFADITVAGFRHVGWLVVIMPALWALLPKGWPGRRIALLAVVVLLARTPPPPDEDCFDAHVLDVGQGLAVVLQTKQSNVVFDTGASFRSGGSVAEQVLVPFLESKGISYVDRLVISHADIDHSGGAGAVHAYADIGHMLAGEKLRDASFVPDLCVTGQNWVAGDVRFSILHPGSGRARDGNDSSCVLLVEVGAHRLLLTGDIEAQSERVLIRGGKLGVIDIVVVPHHGSLTSSSQPFVDVVSPLVAIVSAGYANRWGFPKQQVVTRWESVGADVLSTASSGAISLRLCARSGLQYLRRNRYEQQRFWHDQVSN